MVGFNISMKRKQQTTNLIVNGFRVDQILCTHPTCTVCVTQAPQFFGVDQNNGKAKVIHQPSANEEPAVLAIACPVNAIKEIGET